VYIRTKKVTVEEGVKVSGRTMRLKPDMVPRSLEEQTTRKAVPTTVRIMIPYQQTCMIYTSLYTVYVVSIKNKKG